jgi:hypothetical protein
MNGDTRGCRIGFQPMIVVRRDIDRYSDRFNKSEAPPASNRKIASLLLNRLSRCPRVREAIG